jgi:hypothetical protein
MLSSLTSFDVFLGFRLGRERTQLHRGRSSVSAEKNASASSASPLTELEKAVLVFEQSWVMRPEAKDEAIRQTFDFSATKYYQILSGLLDSRPALEFDPMLIKRLQREREQRRRSREIRLHPSHQKDRD